MYFVWGETLNLKTIVKNGEALATYTYNESGIRTSKTVDGITHTYSLNGTLVTFESYGDIFIAYIYDENGSPIGMAIRDASTADITQSQEEQFSYYLFTKNLQGDIIGIYDEEGKLVAEYTYNAWGEHTVTNHTSANIGNINPFRYRGYFYDNETGYYYLNTRYYNPQIKRFISADNINYLGANGDLNAYNLYAYCSNNPVMYVDPNGNIAISTAILIGAIVGVGVGGLIGGIVAYNSAKGTGASGAELAYETAVGVAKGVAIGAVAGALIGATGGILSTYAGASATNIISTAAITTMLNVSSRTAEVSILQAKKSISEGKNGWQVADDCINAIFTNSIEMQNPVASKFTFTSLGYARVWKQKSIFSYFNTYNNILFSYLSPAWELINLAYSFAYNDPSTRAIQRSYALI